MIAMALSCNPALLIADEPTTALDLTVQAQILDLLMELQQDFDMAIMMITDDLGVVSEMADQVAVMYLGFVVEYADAHRLFHKPLHPYLQALLRSLPSMEKERRRRLEVIKGVVPQPFAIPEGCRFTPRCQYAQGICREEEPSLKDMGEGHLVACHFAADFLS
jgi:oligopeptide/dipeptide ABC transporter ATP-binding protein